MALAMVFPGQGSQSVGMQADLAAEYPVVGETYAEASEALGYDLWQLVQEGPGDRLDATEVTQPAMLTASVAAWRSWRAAGGGDATLMAGHSLGEYSALVCAGALDFRDAVSLVRQRGRFMQNAVPAGEGAMAAILGLDDDQVLEVCERASARGVAEAVNFNAPGQVVVSGAADAVGHAVELARAAGAKRAILVKVSAPMHSSLLRPAGEQLAVLLGETSIDAPSVGVISCIDVRRYRDADDIRELLTRQVYSPVQWTATCRALVAAGATRIIECGPGKVLTGLMRRIDRSVDADCIDSPGDLGKLLA